MQIGQAATFHVNHVIPRSRRGPTTLGNLVLQCPSCSLHKSDKIVGRDEETNQDWPLFHPLKQDWSEHFALREDGACAGKTPFGRATVAALRMNEPIARTARAIQLRMKLL